MSQRWKRYRHFFVFFLVTILLFAGCGENKSDQAIRTGTDNVSSKDTSETENSEDDKKSTSNGQAEDEDDLKDKDDSIESDLFMILSLDSEEEQIIVKSLSSLRKFRYGYSLGTRFLNKFGNNQSMTDFKEGTIVTIVMRDNHMLDVVQMYGDAWTVEDLTNYSIDPDNEIFEIGQTKYRIRPTTEVFSDDLEVTAADIRETDILRVVGIDKEILSIVVITGHGYISVIHTEAFDDSIMSIGTKIFTMLHGNTTVEVPEGVYNLTVAKDGYGGTKEVTVNRNETVTVDLNTLRGEGPKVCKLTIHVPVEDARIYLNGNRYSKDTQFDVVYGEYKLKVEADGYETWEKTLVVNSPSAEISLDLSDEKEKEKERAASAEQSSGNSNNANSNNASTANEAGTQNNTNGNSQNANSGTNQSNSQTNERDSEIDYLTTLSNMISTLTGN